MDIHADQHQPVGRLCRPNQDTVDDGRQVNEQLMGHIRTYSAGENARDRLLPAPPTVITPIAIPCGISLFQSPPVTTCVPITVWLGCVPWTWSSNWTTQQPLTQDYHWLGSGYPLEMMRTDLTEDETLWDVLWTQSVSKEGGGRMKTYHYGTQIVGNLHTLFSIDSGLCAAAVAVEATAKAAQSAATAMVTDSWKNPTPTH